MNSNGVRPACDLTYYKFIPVLIENTLFFGGLWISNKKGGKKDMKFIYLLFLQY